MLAKAARLGDLKTLESLYFIGPESGLEAAYKGQTKLVEYLLQFRSDLTIPDKTRTDTARWTTRSEWGTKMPLR